MCKVVVVANLRCFKYDDVTTVKGLASTSLPTLRKYSRTLTLVQRQCKNIYILVRGGSERKFRPCVHPAAIM